MKTRALVNSTMAAFAVLTASTPGAFAAPFPLLDPGFDVFQAGTMDPIVDDRFSGFSGPQTNTPLSVASTAAATTETGDIPAGWVVFGGGNGRFRDDVELLVPTGTMAIAASPDPTVFAQNLGVPAEANATYFATIDVSDRNSAPIAGGTDVTFLSPNISLQLVADIGPNQEALSGILTFSPPPNGGTSTMTLSVTTGAEVPAGNLSFVFSCFGNSGGANTHTLFDNATLDAPAIDNADFDGDDDVDGADFLIWQRGVGDGMTQPEGDADFDEDVDGEDLGIWETQFGGGVQSIASASAIPEPGSGLLSLMAILVGLLALNNGQRGARRALHCR